MCKEQLTLECVCREIYVGTCTWQGFSVLQCHVYIRANQPNDMAIPVFIKMCLSTFFFEVAHTDEGSRDP